MRILRSMHLLELPADSPELSGEAFRHFTRVCFAPLRNPDGSWMRSRAERHSDLDRRLVEILRDEGLQPKVFMDVGMANGLSTLETIRRLADAGMPVRTIATDRNVEAFVLRIHENLDVLCDANGHVLLSEWNGRALLPWNSRWDHLTGRSLPKMLLAARVKRSLRKLGLPLRGAAAPTGPGVPAVEGPYLLVTPELKNRPDVEVRIDDVLLPLPADLKGVADVVRVVNVLRPDRFPPAQLRRAAENIRERCREGAILIVGRNRVMKGKHLRWASTFFRAEPNGRLSVLDRLGIGSEVERYFADVGNGGQE